jgi:hypothetical protein
MPVTQTDGATFEIGSSAGQGTEVSLTLTEAAPE